LKPRPSGLQRSASTKCTTACPNLCGIGNEFLKIHIFWHMMRCLTRYTEMTQRNTVSTVRVAAVYGSSETSVTFSHQTRNLISDALNHRLEHCRNLKPCTQMSVLFKSALVFKGLNYVLFWHIKRAYRCFVYLSICFEKTMAYSNLRYHTVYRSDKEHKERLYRLPKQRKDMENVQTG
jgi:hypothetical protein